MPSATKLIDEEVISQLVKDIGLENTRMFIAALKDEFTLRKRTIKGALAAGSLRELASEAHAFKGMAQTYGASALAGLLFELETQAKAGNAAAFVLASETLALAEETDLAFQNYQLDS